MSRFVPAALEKFASRGIYVPENAMARYDSISTPNWMISFDELVNSSVKGYEEYCELFASTGSAARLSQGHLASQQFSSGTMQHSDIAVIIPFGDYAPTLKDYMARGQTIECIEIVRLAHINGYEKEDEQLKIITCIDHGNAKIQTWDWDMANDRLILSYRFETETLTSYRFKQDGTAEGQVFSELDFTKNTSGITDELSKKE